MSYSTPEKTFGLDADVPTRADGAEKRRLAAYAVATHRRDRQMATLEESRVLRTVQITRDYDTARDKSGAAKRRDRAMRHLLRVSERRAERIRALWQAATMEADTIWRTELDAFLG